MWSGSESPRLRPTSDPLNLEYTGFELGHNGVLKLKEVTTRRVIYRGGNKWSYQFGLWNFIKS